MCNLDSHVAKYVICRPHNKGKGRKADYKKLADERLAASGANEPPAAPKDKSAAVGSAGATTMSHANMHISSQ
jgi:hypothetical protein